MADKAKYTPPQVYEVPLRQEQAVLAACTITFTTAAVQGGSGHCGTGSGAGGVGCKGRTAGGQNQTIPAS